MTDPHTIHQAFTDAVNAKDLDALVALYEPGGTAVHLDGAQYTGEQALREMLGGLLEGVDRMEGTTRKVYVAGDLALTSADWSAVFKPDDVVQHGTTAELLRRQPDGSWRIVIDDPSFS